MEQSIDDPVSSLKGIRLRIYCYLLQQEGPVGVRETQRALHLKSASHSAYHLQKLVELKIAKKTPQNAYYVKDEFKVKTIQVNVLTEYYLIAGRFWPRSVFFAVYLVSSLLIGLLLVSLDQVPIFVVYVILSAILAIGIAVYEVWHQVQALPWDKEIDKIKQ